MKTNKAIITVLVSVLIIPLLVFFLGRYGWKLGGFNACQGAGIENVIVTDDYVTIDGFYPGSFPEGFLGYHAEEKDGKLYAGFKFSAVFGFFETGDFTVQIPTKGQITEVILKTGKNEFSMWNAQESSVQADSVRVVNEE